jgi:hypothetical protein
MILVEWVEISPLLSLIIILGSLVSGVIYSLIKK